MPPPLSDGLSRSQSQRERPVRVISSPPATLPAAPSSSPTAVATAATEQNGLIPATLSRPPAVSRSRSYEKPAAPSPAAPKAAAQPALGHSDRIGANAASARLTSFLRNPPPTHMHIPPSLAGSLLIDSQHSPFHRRTLSRQDAANNPRRPLLNTSFSDHRPPAQSSDASLSRAQSTRASPRSPTSSASSSLRGSTSSVSSSATSSSASSSDNVSTSSSSGAASFEEENAPATSPGDHSGRKAYAEDWLLQPWLTPQEFERTAPSISRREMEQRLGNLHSYFDGD